MARQTERRSVQIFVTLTAHRTFSQKNIDISVLHTKYHMPPCNRQVRGHVRKDKCV